MLNPQEFRAKSADRRSRRRQRVRDNAALEEAVTGNRPRKKRKRKTVKNELDLVFARNVRREYIAKIGTTLCQFCQWRFGAPEAEEITDAFHFFGRGHEMTRWDRRNVPIATCRKCNLAFSSDSGFHDRMVVWFKETFPGVWEIIEPLWHTLTDFSRDDLEVKLAEEKRLEAEAA